MQIRYKMVNFYNFKILQQLIPFFVFFNAKNLCVSQNLLNTHHVANSCACDLFKNNFLPNMPLSFFAEKRTRFFVCAGGCFERNANDAKNANLRKMFARRGVLHTPSNCCFDLGVCNTIRPYGCANLRFLRHSRSDLFSKPN